MVLMEAARHRRHAVGFHLHELREQTDLTCSDSIQNGAPAGQQRRPGRGVRGLSGVMEIMIATAGMQVYTLSAITTCARKSCARHCGYDALKE